MTVFVLIIALVLLMLGIFGSVIPGLPGPPISYIGILLIHFFTEIQFSSTFIWAWGIVVALVFVLDYTLQSWGVAKFGGGRYSTIGTFIGLFIGLFFPPVGLLLGPFFGAFFGALAEVKGDQARALKVALGSLVGFVSGAVLKLSVSLALLFYSIYFIWF